MKAARIHRQGAAEELKIETVPIPQAGPGQILIRVESASVNFSDVKRRRGDTYPFPTELPFVPGGEVAGTVAALGDGVAGPAVGTPVFGLAGGSGQGGYAQYALAFAPQVNPIPTTMEFDNAAALVIAGGTAMLLLKHVARLQPGETILIPAAAGSVGSYAVQIAKHMQAGLIIAAASSQSKQQEATALGADVALDYTRAGWAGEVLRATGGRGVDVLLESSGGAVFAQGLRALAPFGRAIVYGAASGQAAQLDADTMNHVFYAPSPNQSLISFNLGGWFIERGQAAGAAMGELVGLVASGAIKPPRIKTLPLADAARAHQLLESRQTSGKLILKPWQ
jgi:NADPH:quinone reductase-like Zn-dependent oxidoreductase